MSNDTTLTAKIFGMGAKHDATYVNKVLRLEYSFEQWLLKTISWTGPLAMLVLAAGRIFFGLSTMHKKAPVNVLTILMALFQAAAMIGVAAIVILTAAAFMRYAATNWRTRMQGWLLAAVVLVVGGLTIRNWLGGGTWILVGVMLLASTVGQIKRPLYEKLTDALMLWEPDDKTSVYHNFTAAKQAAKLL